MPWFKVDDNLAFHAKVVAAGNSAMGLWVRAGAWSAQHLTDGHVPDHIVAMLGTGLQAAKLCRVGLWHATPEGYSFHEWDERQPKRDVIEAERAAARERMKAVRATKKGTQGASPLVSGKRSPELLTTAPQAFGNPDPTRPDPNKNTATATRFAEFWTAYPKKVAKGAAEKAWAKATKKADEDTLIAAAVDYAALSKGTEPQFVKHPATWLNQECWLDEAKPATPVRPSGYRIEEDWSA